MPVYGIRDLAPLRERAHLMAGLDAAPLTLPGASVLQLMFELRQGAMQTLLPAALHPTIPPTLVLAWTQVPGGPFGAFTLAEARIGCRAGARPRAFVARAYTDSERAAAELRAGWGYPVELGDEVRLERGYDRVRGIVSVAGKTAVDASLRNPEAIGGGDIQYLANVNLALVPSGEGPRLRLVQVDPEYSVQRADRGRPSIDVFDPEAWLLPGADPWWPVSASLATADIELPRIRYLLRPEVPAIEGLERVGE